MFGASVRPGRNGLLPRLGARLQALAEGKLGEQRIDDSVAAQSERLFDALPDAMLVLDAAGTVVAANTAAQTLFRAARSALLARSIETLLPECSVERITVAIQHGQGSFDGTTQRARLHTEGLRRGARVPIELNVGRHIDNPAQLVCVLRDMSEQRRIEEEMRLYKRAIASSSNGIVISDVGLPDQPILYVNPAFERMTGYDLAAAFGRNCRFLQGPDTDPAAIDKMRAAIARGAECQITVRNYNRDGQPFWNYVTLAPVRDRTGQVTHYIGIQTDLTELKSIEAVLEERHEQLDAIFNLSPDGFAALDHDGRVTYVNPAFLRVTGLEADDVQGANASTLDAIFERRRDPAHEWRSLSAALAEVAAPAAGETLLATPPRVQDLVVLRDPVPRYLQRSVRRAGGATEYVLYLRDVTRETEVDRMKSEFLSSATHELRTPLASIFGYAELLLKREYPEARRREMLETIHRQARQLTQLVNELLDLARIEARQGKDLKLADQPLWPIVRETIDSFLMPGDARRVEVALPATSPTVRVDAGRLRQALENIVANAYKYSPNGGRIRLWSEARHVGGRDYVGIHVSDEGIGMTPEQVARACERFYRADSSGRIPGTGLGLTLVKETMELQGGSVDIASDLTRGTTVSLWLPMRSRQASVQEDAVETTP